MPRPATKFLWNRLSSFCIILLANRHRWKHKLRGGGEWKNILNENLEWKRHGSMRSQGLLTQYTAHSHTILHLLHKYQSPLHGPTNSPPHFQNHRPPFAGPGHGNLILLRNSYKRKQIKQSKSNTPLKVQSGERDRSDGSATASGPIAVFNIKALRDHIFDTRP